MTQKFNCPSCGDPLFFREQVDVLRVKRIIRSFCKTCNTPHVYEIPWRDVGSESPPAGFKYRDRLRTPPDSI